MIIKESTNKLKMANLLWKSSFLIVSCLFLCWIVKILEPQFNFSEKIFLTIHINIEFFCVFVAFCFFTVTWYSYLGERVYYSYFIGVGLLAVGFIDLFHLYTYKGMPDIFSSQCPNKATIFYIIGRILMAFTFLFSLLLYNRELKITKQFRFFLLITTLGLVVLIIGTVSLNPQLYPTMYAEGQGLTDIKVYCEYFIIVVLFLTTIGYVYLYKKYMKPFLELIVLSLLLSIFSEICFISYENVYATTNVLGHVFRFAGYILLYVTFFMENVKKPYVDLYSIKEQLVSTNQILEEKVRERTLELQKAMEEMARLAYYDTLTGAANRQEFSNRFITILNKSLGNDVHSVMAIDFDSFKTINDTYGHAKGDDCLKTFVDIALEIVRPTDTVSRFGGDEFMLLLPYTPREGAKVVADKIRKRLAEVANPLFTISIGIAQWPDDGKKEKDLLAKADQQLYLAKEKGKNRIE